MKNKSKDATDKARRLRRIQTPAERILWSRIRNEQLSGIKFRRQHPIGPLIANFFCCSSNLVIEIDGDTHANNTTEDQKRTDYLMEQGIHVIRFTNQQVYHEIDQVLEEILRAIQEERLDRVQNDEEALT